MIAALRAEQTANSDNLIQSLSGAISSNNDKMMQNMAQMFAMSRGETLTREQVLRDEVSAAAKRTDSVAAQVAFLTNAVSDLRGQLSSASDFTVDAVQQVRSELEDKVSKGDSAPNAGGALPGSSSDKNMVMKTEKSIRGSEKVDDYNTQCAYCDGWCRATSRNIAKIAIFIFILDTTASTRQNGHAHKLQKTTVLGAISTLRSTRASSSATCASTLCTPTAVPSTARVLMVGTK